MKEVCNNCQGIDAHYEWCPHNPMHQSAGAADTESPPEHPQDFLPCTVCRQTGGHFDWCPNYHAPLLEGGEGVEEGEEGEELAQVELEPKVGSEKSLAERQVDALERIAAALEESARIKSS